MNIFKAALDTRHQNGVIGTVTQFDNAVLELQIVTDGQVSDAWEEPQFELIAMKRDANVVREVDQDRFTILSKEDHKVQIELKEQFLTCRGTVKMQLVVKDGSRLSTTLFYLVIGQSLDHDIVESHRDVAVLDELEAYIKQGFDDLAYQEQRMAAVEQSTNDLNDTMNANEAERNAAETKRSQIFETNETNRTQTFNNQIEEQSIAFSNAQTQREKDFSESQQNMSQEFETSQKERESDFNELQKSNQKTFETNEQKRQTTFSQSQGANKQTFTQNETDRQRIFESNESDRQESESQRVQNELERVKAETQRAAAELSRQQKMTEFEEKATQLSEDLDNQVARVDEFVSANEAKLLGPNDKKDYMGNSHESVKDAMDANVDWLLGEVNTAHYEGQHITATDTLEGRAKSAILTGQTLVNLLSVSNVVVNKESFVKIINLNQTPKIGDKCLIKIKINSVFESTNGMPIKITLWNEDTSNGYILINSDEFKVGFEKSFLLTVIDGDYFQKSRIKIWGRDIVNGEANIDIIIIPYQDDMENWDIPYFEGMQSVKMPVLKAIGKNLFDGYLEKGIIDGNTGKPSPNESFVRSVNFIKVQSNKIYTISEKDDSTGFRVYEFDGNFNYIGELTKKTFTTSSNTSYIKFRTYPKNSGDDVSSLDFKFMLETGNTITPYEPYKSNILSTSEDVVLRAIGDVQDTLDLITGDYVQRIGEYTITGGESNLVLNTMGAYPMIEIIIQGVKDNSRIMSNKIYESLSPIYSSNTVLGVDVVANIIRIRTQEILDGQSLDEFKKTMLPLTVKYEIAQEVIKTVDLSDNHVYSYKGTTHYDCSSAEGSLVPTLSIDVPTNLPAVVARQRVTIQELEKENVALKNEIEETANSSVNGDLELMSSQFELDFRIFEIEMNLDMPMMAMMRGVKSMAMTVYQQAKTLILAGKYERENMEYKLNRYKEAGRITVEEYKELIALMDARELVD